jgi:hypothetical protein
MLPLALGQQEHCGKNFAASDNEAKTIGEFLQSIVLRANTLISSHPRSRSARPDNFLEYGVAGRESTLEYAETHPG